MKRLLIPVLLILMCLLPVQAQEDCEINLLDAISKLAEAQSAASSGDTATATQLISGVQAELDALLATCAQGSAALPMTFEFPDGLFRFNHPNDWTVQSPVRGVYVLGNDQSAVNTIVESNVGEDIPAGAQILIAAYGDMEAVFDVNSFDELLELVQEDAFSETQFIAPQDVEVNGYQGVKLRVSSQLFDGTAYVLDLNADNKIALFISLTPQGEFAAFEPVFEAVVASMQVGKRPAAQNPAPQPVIENTGKPLSELTYMQALKLQDTIEGFGGMDSKISVLSPDGTRLAWFAGPDEGICLYTFADSSTQCQPIPEIFNSLPVTLLWSPDSRYIAFNQDGVIRLEEPDIWVFNTESRTFVNRTDDHINFWRFGREPDPADSPGPLWFDYSFTWGPDGSIFFMRLDVPDSSDFGNYTTGLYRVAPESGEAELIRDLTADFERLSIYQMAQYDLRGALAVSPDATRIAFTVMERDRESDKSGVWVMPLSGDEAPRQAARTTDFALGLTEEFRENEFYLFPTGLAWTPDQTGLYVFTYNPQFTTDVSAMLYHVEIQSGILTPLVDFSEYTRAEVFATDDSGHSPAYFIPRAAVMSPDGTTLIMFHSEVGGGAAGITAFIPGENGFERTTLLEFDLQRVPAQTVSVSADGKLLISGALFLPEE